MHVDVAVIVHKIVFCGVQVAPTKGGWATKGAVAVAVVIAIAVAVAIESPSATACTTPSAAAIRVSWFVPTVTSQVACLATNPAREASWPSVTDTLRTAMLHCV